MTTFPSLIYLLLIITYVKSFDFETSLRSIEELFKDQDFVSAYEQRTRELFSDQDYLYGKSFGEFPCSTNLVDRLNSSMNKAISVHQLRPNDIQCVAAIGDSLTAALGAHASTPIGLFTENRGVSWSIGGDQDFDHLLTLPNILRRYNSKLTGYSTKSSVIFLKGQNSSHNGLNVAKSGDKSYHLLDQAKILVERFESNEFCNPKNDWKMITLFIGGNDLCIFCEDFDKHKPSNFVNYITETLDYLQKKLTRAFVNLVLVLDVRYVKELNEGGTVCRLLHDRTCPCAAFPKGNDSVTLQQWIPQYQCMLVELINTDRYEQRDDFTVVIQPFFAQTQLPRLLNGEIDFSYFAPDCFHLSGKGHSRAALSLWNNLMEPVGQKQWAWHNYDRLICPTPEHPYFYTRKNSPQSIEIIPCLKSIKA